MQMLKTVSTVLVTVVLTSTFWILAYSIARDPNVTNGDVTLAGDKNVTNRQGTPSVDAAKGVTVGPTGLTLPVAGVRPDQLADTFTQAREAGERVHDAIDIMAPAGTPVVAAAQGTVEKLFFSQAGGITAYVRSDDDRWIFYYAHLQSYASGFGEGQKVARGQLIGRVGSTGNASAKGPHLHFAIHGMAPQEEWWKGTPINPYPLLVR